MARLHIAIWVAEALVWGPEAQLKLDFQGKDEPRLSWL